MATSPEQTALEAAEKNARASEMQHWIAEQGSAHLQRANTLGYNVVGLYIRERSDQELPGFTYAASLDVEDRVSERSNPSAFALDLKAQTQAQLLAQPDSQQRSEVDVVWLRTVRGGVDESEGDPRDQEEAPLVGEAVRVQHYLGRATLYQPLDSRRSLARSTSRIADLLHLEMSLPDALITEAGRTYDKRLRHVFTQLVANIQATVEAKQKAELWQVLREYPAVFPDYYIRTVRAGEEGPPSYTLPNALKLLASSGVDES